MRRSLSAFVVTLCLALLPSLSRAETTAQEAAEHPRIAKAINELEDAVRYMEAAPHNFDGHKAAAIQASRKAIEQLRLALRYRAHQDTMKGK